MNVYEELPLLPKLHEITAIIAETEIEEDSFLD
jgi:hypothetical protein